MADLDDTIVINSAPQGHGWAIIGVAIGCLIMLAAFLVGIRGDMFVLSVFVLGGIVLVGSVMWGAMRFYDRRPILVISPFDLTDNRCASGQTIAWNSMRDITVVRVMSDGDVVDYEITFEFSGERRRLGLQALEYEPAAIFELLEKYMPLSTTETTAAPTSTKQN